MLRPRLIPCLLISNGRLVKTVNFKSPKYVGDPLNAVRIFNEKCVDELIVLDIDASRVGNKPDFDLIRVLAKECRMPLCYGGGVCSVEQIENLIHLGVEKVAVGTSAFTKPELISQAVARVGRQSIVGVVDVIKSAQGGYETVVKNATVGTGITPVDFAKGLCASGVGEILLNSVAQDGTMGGYDTHLIRTIYNEVNVPVSVLGGAGSLDDFRDIFQKFGTIGACAGSFFVFKGKYKAVLINYPGLQEKQSLWVPNLSSQGVL